MRKRLQLIDRSGPLEGAANRKLFLPRNQNKGDEWREHSDLYLKEMILGEVAELFDLIDDHRAGRTHMTDKEYRQELLKEGGDIVNGVRFTLDKHGCFDQTPRVQVLDTPPTSPAEGQMYEDANDGLKRYYNGVFWETLPKGWGQ